MPKGQRKLINDAIEKIKLYASPETTISEVMEMLKMDGINLTYDQAKGIYFRHKFPFKRNVRHNLLMTDDQAALLMAIIPGRSSAETTKLFNEKTGLNLKESQIRGWKKNHRTPSGYDAKFRKGNKGHPHYGMVNSGTFKPGHKPANEKEVGTITVRDRYKLIKVANNGTPDDWQFYHRYVYEMGFGLIPDGMTVTFKDGDSMNCALDNLLLQSKREHAVVNLQLGGAIKGQPELNQAIRTMAKLKIKIWENKKK